ncbi:hypothetical protein [Chryseobacterium sp. MFBS3-17]|uniref:hypothetical protein n=1 Tax=Chryseobacterium sp. MFBS3-17 TaxID=2886689 RepID=UPI001D0DCB6A|nr:hypothetical protein [Chryseobacterium sp. MFBS3-17]MCC2590365.1 hypothetical protein [Chryseobacterium sp. MFBS3-17]
MSLATTKADAQVAVKAILDDMLTREDTSTQEFADRLINVLEEWLKEAAVIYVAGLVAGSTPVTGTFNGSLE